MKNIPEPRWRAGNRIQAIGYALQGWWYVIRTQRNAWVHAVASVLVFALGLFLGVSRLDWVGLVLVVALVWCMEFFNTALEAVIDIISPDYHPLAKIGKDVAATAVLVAAGAAVMVGLLILGPPLWVQLMHWLPMLMG